MFGLGVVAIHKALALETTDQLFRGLIVGPRRLLVELLYDLPNRGRIALPQDSQNCQFCFGYVTRHVAHRKISPSRFVETSPSETGCLTCCKTCCVTSQAEGWLVCEYEGFGVVFSQRMAIGVGRVSLALTVRWMLSYCPDCRHLPPNGLEPSSATADGPAAALSWRAMELRGTR